MAHILLCQIVIEKRVDQLKGDAMRKIALLLMTIAVALPAPAWAVPILQVGVPNGTGGYVDYTDSGSDEDTAFTSGYVIHVAGVRAENQNKDSSLQLGGPYPGGKNWSDFGFPTDFDGKGAILLVSVPESPNDSLSYYSGLQISLDNSAYFSAFYFSDEPSYFPNNHYPVKNDIADFLYFDIGNFSDTEFVPDFASETGSAKGEIKVITFTLGNLNLGWMHFDVMALETTKKNGGQQTQIITTLENNPGSHDVTWTNGGSPPQVIPEPATMLLIGSGFVVTGIVSRKKNRKQN